MVTNPLDIPRVSVQYVAKHGDDSNPGDTPDLPKLTINAAIAVAGAQNNTFFIRVLDGEVYVENVELPHFSVLEAEAATLMGYLWFGKDSWARINRIVSPGSMAVPLVDFSPVGLTNLGKLDCQEIRTDPSDTMVNVITVGGTTSENLTVEVGRIRIDNSNVTACYAGDAFLSGYINCIDTEGSPTGVNGIAVNDGKVLLRISEIDVDGFPYDTLGTGELQLTINKQTAGPGNPTNNGEAKVNLPRKTGEVCIFAPGTLPLTLVQGALTTLVFDALTDVVPEDTGYNTTTGLWTCPATGQWQFHFRVLANIDPGYNVFFILNIAAFGPASRFFGYEQHTGAATQLFGIADGTGPITLNKGDTAQIQYLVTNTVPPPTTGVVLTPSFQGTNCLEISRRA